MHVTADMFIIAMSDQQSRQQSRQDNQPEMQQHDRQVILPVCHHKFWSLFRLQLSHVLRLSGKRPKNHIMSCHLGDNPITSGKPRSSLLDGCRCMGPGRLHQRDRLLYTGAVQLISGSTTAPWRGVPQLHTTRYAAPFARICIFH